MLVNDNEIKVSILVPIYGVEKYIEKCAISLMEQTYMNIEYIFVNDCTKDSSIDILKRVISCYPERQPYTKILNHNCNRGLAAARNTAVDACSGDYLMHVDSDDWLVNNAVEKLIAFAEEKNSDVVLFGNYNVYRDHQEESKASYSDKTSYISGILLHTIPASIWNKFYKTAFYKESGIRSIEGINHGEDYVVVPRLLHKAKNIDVLNELLYFYNLTNQSSYTQNVTLKSIESVHSAFEVVYEYFNGVDDKNEYTATMKVLPLRSMLALTKKASKENYGDILNLYAQYLEVDSRSLSKSDKLILLLLKAKQFYTLNCLIKLYKHFK